MVATNIINVISSILPQLGNQKTKTKTNPLLFSAFSNFAPNFFPSTGYNYNYMSQSFGGFSSFAPNSSPRMSYNCSPDFIFNNMMNMGMTGPAVAYMNIISGGLPQINYNNYYNGFSSQNEQLQQLMQQILNLSNILTQSSSATTESTNNENEILDAKDLSWFDSADKNNTGKISWDEYLNNYIQGKENERNKAFTEADKTSEEYRTYLKEARNLFNALKTYDKDDNTNYITRENYERFLSFVDEADRCKDNNISGNIFNRIINAFKKYGPEAIINNGKTYKEIIG